MDSLLRSRIIPAGEKSKMVDNFRVAGEKTERGGWNKETDIERSYVDVSLVLFAINVTTGPNPRDLLVIVFEDACNRFRLLSRK